MFYDVREKLLDWIYDLREHFDVKGSRDFYQQDYEEDVEECRKIGEDGLYTQVWFMNEFVQSWRFRLYVVLPGWLAEKWWDHAVWGAHRRKCIADGIWEPDHR
jgi:hypothetical protein